MRGCQMIGLGLLLGVAAAWAGDGDSAAPAPSTRPAPNGAGAQSAMQPAEGSPTTFREILATRAAPDLRTLAERSDPNRMGPEAAEAFYDILKLREIRDANAVPVLERILADHPSSHRIHRFAAAQALFCIDTPAAHKVLAGQLHGGRYPAKSGIGYTFSWEMSEPRRSRFIERYLLANDANDLVVGLKANAISKEGLIDFTITLRNVSEKAFRIRDREIYIGEMLYFRSAAGRYMPSLERIAYNAPMPKWVELKPGDERQWRVSAWSRPAPAIHGTWLPKDTTLALETEDFRYYIDKPGRFDVVAMFEEALTKDQALQAKIDNIWSGRAVSKPVQVEIVDPDVRATTQPAPNGASTQPAEGPVQTDWSAPREGVQMRLRAARKTWRADEIPALRWDVRNVGTRKFLQVGDGQRLAQLEVDGVWHQWPTGLRSARLADMGAGAWLEDQLVTASPIWSRAMPEDLEWRRDGGGKIVLSGEESPPSLHLKPGAHTLHVAAVIQPSRADTGDGFRVVSEPMDITIEALPAGQTASWPPGTKLAQAVKEALYRAQIPLQNSLRPWEPGMKDWIAGALAKAKQAATLAEKKPLHASASRLADAFAALQQAVDKDPAGAAKEFSAAGDAYRDLVGVFAGVTRPAPSGAGTQPAAEASATIATFAKLPPATQSATAPLAGSRLAAPATQPAAQLVLQTRNIELMQKRDALLARADADIRAGLLALAKEFPQIAQADGWKAVAGKSRAGEVNLGLYWKVEAYPKTASPRGDAFALTVILSLGRPACTQPAWFTLYGNLGLVGKVAAKAGDLKLDAALKTLVTDALTPLDELDKHIGAATQSATPRASPPTSVPIDPAAAWEAKVGQTITLQGHAIRQKSGIIYLRPADDACPYWSVELEHVLPDLRGGGAPLPVRVTGTLRLRKHTFSQEEVEQYKRDLAEGKKQMQAGNREVGQIIRHYYIPDAVVTILPVATQPAPQPATRPAGPSQAARAGAMNPATTRPA